MTSVLAAALWYARCEWPVLPLQGKIARLPDWPHAASTDPAQLNRWFSQPGRNVGVVTGPRSGLLVLDVDPRNGGTGSLGALEAEVGVLPGTLTALTGGGGCHLVFRYPDGVTVKSRANALGPGLDVKAAGGYIVVPPSIHPDTGGAYEWQGGTPAVEIAELPAAVLDRLTPPVRLTVLPGGQSPVRGSARPDRVLAGIVQVVMDAPQGERNSRLYWAACRVGEHVRAGTLDSAVALEALVLAADAVGLTPAEARATIRSASRASGGGDAA